MAEKGEVTSQNLGNYYEQKRSFILNSCTVFIGAQYISLKILIENVLPLQSGKMYHVDSVGLETPRTSLYILEVHASQCEKHWPHFTSSHLVDPAPSPFAHNQMPLAIPCVDEPLEAVQ